MNSILCHLTSDLNNQNKGEIKMTNTNKITRNIKNNNGEFVGEY